MSIVYRAATPADAATIAATGAAIFLTTYAVDGVSEDLAEYALSEFTPTRLRQTFRLANARTWLALGADGVVGFVHLTLDKNSPVLTDARQAEVARLYVLATFARRGIGRKLLSLCTEHAFTAGTDVVWLTVWVGNEPALRFYRALGWQDVGETAFVLGGVSHENRVLALRRPR